MPSPPFSPPLARRLAVPAVVPLTVAGVLVATLAHESGSRPAFVAAVLVAALFVALSLSWRSLLVAVVVTILVEALPRRYLVNDVGIYFVKDVFVGIAYLKFARDRLQRPLAIPRSLPVVLLLALCALFIVQLANPALPVLVVGVLGLHTWLWYVPLAWLVADAVDSSTEGLRWIRRFALVSLPIAVLGMAQIWSAMLNESYYADIHGKSAYGVKDTVIPDRSVGTFASTGAYGDYLDWVVIAAVALGAAARTRRQRLEVVAVFAGILLGLGGTGSKGVAVVIILGTAFSLILARRFSARERLVAALSASIFALSFVLYPALPGLYRAVVAGFSPASISMRVSDHIQRPLEEGGTSRGPGGTSRGPGGTWRGPGGTWRGPGGTWRGPSGEATTPGGTSTSSRPPRPKQTVQTLLIGHGVGLGTAGRQYLEPLLSDVQFARVEALAGPEGGWLDVVWEFGATGLALIVAVLLSLGWTAREAYRAARTDETRALATFGFVAVAVTFAVSTLSTRLGQVNYTILFWLAVGLIFAARRIAAAEVETGTA